MRHLKRVILSKAGRGSGTTKAVHVIAWIASIVLGGMVVSAALAGAATDPPSPAPTQAKAGEAPVNAPMPACPMCPMMAGGGKGMGMGMDMPPAMRQRCQMMMNAEMSKDDAACLLAIKEELKLTPEQVQKLEQIVKQSRQEAAAILTPEQQKTLAEVPGQSTSMSAMHAKMHEKMMQKMEGGSPKTTEEKPVKAPEGGAAPKK
jgi:hypothetical protein